MSRTNTGLGMLAALAMFAISSQAQAQFIVASYAPAPIVAGTHYYAGYPSGVYYGSAYPTYYAAPIVPVTYAVPAPVVVSPVYASYASPVIVARPYYGMATYRVGPLGGVRVRYW